MSFIRILLLLLCCSALWAAPAAAKQNHPTVHIAASEWPPYINNTPDSPGVVVEIVSTAFKQAGYAPRIHVLPWHRAVSKIEDGSMDVLLAVYDSKRNRERYLLSSGLLRIDSLFATLDGSEAARSGPRKHHKVSVVKDSLLDKDLRKEEYEHVEIAPDAPSNMKKLLTERVDMILDTEATILEAIKQLPAA
ncbi:substrate-binding periplasmic protein [Oleidesulfovibrio sp.]|uniref:substrate-binding periplasmic protein n=1 Tax=Oleidesulfovibrio sp. TaxID=2909707 RepID=UPI003A8B3B81